MTSFWVSILFYDGIIFLENTANELVYYHLTSLQYFFKSWLLENICEFDNLLSDVYVTGCNLSCSINIIIIVQFLNEKSLNSFEDVLDVKVCSLW